MTFKKNVWFIIIVILVFLMVGCTFITDMFYPPIAQKPTMSLSISPKPSYIGEEFEVTLTTRPSGSLSYVRVVLVDDISGKKTEIVKDNARTGTFSFTAPSSSFKIYAESPFQNIEKNNAVWLPSKTSSYSIPDYSPPAVFVDAQRTSPTSNIYNLILNVVENESVIQSVYYDINGQRKYLQPKKGKIEDRITLSIGNHTIKGYASNDSNLTGSSSRYYLNVTPPRVDSKPTITLETISPIEAFDGELIYLSAQIEDSKSFLKGAQLISNRGWNRRFNFDPLQENYYLNYLLKVEESQNITIRAVNGNDIMEQKEIEIIKKDHKVPDVQLSVTPTENKLEVGTKMELTFTASANDGELLKNIFVLVNGSTYQSFMANNAETYSGRLTYSLMKGENLFTVIAQDTKDARGGSNPIMVEGEKIDRQPPLIQMLLPNVAYTGVDVELPFTVEDYDSGIDGKPIIKNEDGELNASTYDGYYYIADWTPGATGTYLFTVEARDKEGNEASATKSVRVKDPTGIVRPTIGDISVTPDPVTLGGSVTVSISVIPPAQDLSIIPIVELNVSSPGGNQAGLSNVQKNGNIYSASYSPNIKGTHIAQAIIQCDEYQYTKTYNFNVLSPDPTLTFTVEPSRTYIGDDIAIKLQTDTSNPYASVTVIEMSVDEDPLVWNTIINNEQKLYTATKSTLNLGEGQHVVKVRIRDSFGNESLKTKLFTLLDPVLTIDSVNLIPTEGILNMVYKDSFFEVFIDRTIPPAIEINGSLRVYGNGIDRSLTLERSNDYRYITSNWQPLEQGSYSVDISMEGIVNSVIYEDTLSASVTVYPPEIGNPLLKMVDPGNTLVYGMGFDFELIFNDPEKTEGLDVTMFLVDENFQKIPEVDLIKAERVDNVSFVSEEPFKLYRPMVFRGAAEITVIEDVGEYEMPIIYSTTSYTLATPALDVNFVDSGKKYYRDLWNSLDIAVTVPGTLNIQPPVVTIPTGNFGSIQNLPYEELPNGVYKYKIKPQQADSLPIIIELFERSDINKNQVLFTKEATLDILDWVPRVQITEMNYVDKVNKSKAPEIQFKVLNLPDPEFYDLKYEFRTLLNSKRPTQGNFVNSEQNSITLSFRASDYSEKLDGESVSVTADVSIFNDTELLKIATDTVDFEVKLPDITSVGFTNRITEEFDIYTENDLEVIFNNNDYVDEYLSVRLTYEKDSSPTSLNKIPNYDTENVIFDNVIFTEVGNYNIQAFVYCTNGPEELLATSTIETVSTRDSIPSVDIVFPTQLDNIYVGQNLQPRIKATSIPNISQVRITVTKDGTRVVSNGAANRVETQDNYAVYELIDPFNITRNGQWQIDALVKSNYVGDSTDTGYFNVSDGEIENVKIEKSRGGGLLFTDEVIEFTGKFSFSNPYNSPSWSASLTNGGSIEQIGSPSTTTNGNLIDYEILFRIASGTLNSGEHEINFKVVSGSSERQSKQSFTVLGPVQVPAYQIGSESISEGGVIEGYIVYTLSNRFTEEATPIKEYITVQIEFPNSAYLSGPTFSLTENASPGVDGKVLVITYRSKAGQHTGGINTEKSFIATFKSSVDGYLILDETVEYTIINDGIDN